MYRRLHSYSLFSCCKLLLIVALLLAEQTFAQFPIEPFQGNRRFPSNELHGIAEDEQGNKWVASDAGLVKITGNAVTVLTRKDGLASDVVLKMYKDPKGRIWLSGPDASLSIIENGTVTSIPANPEIRKIGAVANGLNSMFLGNDGCLYACLAEGGGVQFKLSADRMHAVKTDIGNEPGAGYPFAGLHPDPAQERSFIGYMRSVEPLLFEGKTKFNSIMSMLRNWYYASDGSLLVCYGNTVFQFRDFILVHRYDLSLRVFTFMELEGRLFASAATGGWYELKEGSGIATTNVLSKLSITAVHHDKEGNSWFTTLERGLFVMQQPGMDLLYNNPVNVSKLVKVYNNLCLMLAGGRLIDDQGKEYKGLAYRPYDLRYMTNNPGDSSSLIYFSASGLQIYSKKGVVTLSKKYYSVSEDLPGRRIAFFGGRTLSIYDPVKNIYYDVFFQDRITSVTPLDDSALMVSTFSSGLQKLAAGSKRFEPLAMKGRANCLARISPSEVAVGTNEEGIQLVNNKGEVKGRISNLPNRIQKLVFKAPFLYAATKEGLFLVDPVQKIVKGYNNSNGLPFDEVMDIAVTGDRLYIAGRNMMVTVKIADLAAFHSLPEIGLQEVMVNNNRRIISELSFLTGRLINFSFTLSNSSYRSVSNTIYHYRISEGSRVIMEDSSATPVLNFNLDPGQYQVQLFATDRLLLTRSEEITFPVRIAIPYYRKAGFIVGIAALFLLVVTIITLLIIRRVQRREQKKRDLVLKLADLEARALQGQMNPHFIFNAVNSIQDFILSNRNDEAHVFLSTFASLIRMVLEHNRKKTVTIDEEAALLHLYVSIEEQRLKDHIHLDLVIPEEMDTDNILLPSMLLQPLVENAIWHGLSSIAGEKRVSIEFGTMKDQLLKINISDNGKGIDNAGKMHEPVGLDIVKERIRLAYEEEPEFSFFSISNRQDGQGVTVQIILPLQTAY